MSEENKDLTPGGDKPSETSTPPEGTGEKKSSSPSDASAGKEDVTFEVHESLKTQYSESSTEAKRLKAENDEKDESLQEQKDYIESLETAMEKDKEKDENSKDKGTEGEKSKDKKPEDKKPDEKKADPKPTKEPILPPHLTKEGQKKAMKELLGTEKAETEEAEKQYNTALEEFPRLKNKAFSRLVSSKMKSGKVSVKEACKEVSEDLKSLGSKEGDEEPFVESGAGESTIQHQKTEEDDIKESLKRPQSTGNLPGMV